MTDEEVGGMLRRVNNDKLWDDRHVYIRYDYRRLIRKLVEERAERYSVEDCGKSRSWWGNVFPPSYTSHALQDFDISMTEFNA